GAGDRILTRIQIWPWAGRDRNAALQGHRGLAKGRRTERTRCRDRRGRLIVGGRTGIDDAKAGTEHSLLVDLISSAEARADCVRVYLPETAVTVARSVALEDRGSQQATGRRIR